MIRPPCPARCLPLVRCIGALLALSLPAAPAWCAWPHRTNVNLPVSSEFGAQQSPVSVPDGEGGAILVWQDHRGSNWDVYAQRVDAAGTALWAPGGIPVCSADGDQMAPVAVSDGAGGVIVAWQDNRLDFFLGWDIYALRINAQGELPLGWPSCGIAMALSGKLEFAPVIAPDGAGCAYVAWEF